MDELVTDGVENQHFVFAFANFALVVRFQLPFHADGRHGPQVKERL